MRALDATVKSASALTPPGARDALGGIREDLETGHRDGLAAGLTDSVRLGLEPRQGMLDLAEKVDSVLAQGQLLFVLEVHRPGLGAARIRASLGRRLGHAGFLEFALVLLDNPF